MSIYTAESTKIARSIIAGNTNAINQVNDSNFIQVRNAMKALRGNVALLDAFSPTEAELIQNYRTAVSTYVLG